MPHEVPWSSDITAVEKNKLVTRGVDQDVIIRDYSFAEMMFLLVCERKPTPIETDLLRAVVVSHCSHGITGQSTLSVRMGADCGASFLNSAIGGFLVGSGEYHQGALEPAMCLIKAAAEADDLEAHINGLIASRSPIHGYGHRYHSHDPRALTLMRLCDSHDWLRQHIVAARRIDSIVGSQLGRYMNIEAACGAILLDLGFPTEIASLVILVGRAPMFAAAYLERVRSESRPFQRLAVYDRVPGRSPL